MRGLINAILCLPLVACGGGGRGAPSPESADDPGPGDVGPAAAEPAPAPVEVRRADGSCEILGTWEGAVQGGILAGNDLSLRFSDDGTAQGTVSWVTLNSRWQREGDVVAITDVSARPVLASCDEEVVGRYTLAFEPDCESVRVVGASDECNHRRLALEGLRARRARAEGAPR